MVIEETDESPSLLHLPLQRHLQRLPREGEAL
jgi:hypothetical protein